MNLLLIDDHALFREGVRAILTRLAPQVHVFEAGSIDASMAYARQADAFDLILLDLHLPGMHGLDGLHTLRERFPLSPVVLLSGICDITTIRAGISRGAQGFIPKAVGADTMLNALRCVLDGELWIPQERDVGAAVAPRQDDCTNGDTYLTPRQADVLAQLCEGHSNKEIARILSMSDNTVRSHVAGIFRALGAKSRTEAAALAKRNRLL